MPSLEHALAKAKEKGIDVEGATSKAPQVFTPPPTYNPNPHTPEASLRRAQQGIEYFTEFWSLGTREREQLQTADSYIEKVNFIYESYVSVRRNFDGSVAYLLGDWLNACRREFFPGEDRKTSSEWNRFLEQHLCKGFKKTSANLYMRIADKLQSVRTKKLPIQKLEVLVRLIDSGSDISVLIPKADEMTISELLALKPEKTSLGVNAQRAFVKVIASMAAARRELEKLSASGVSLKEKQVAEIKLEADKIFSLLHVQN